MEFIDGGVTAPKGFYAANTAAGIKYKDRDDMAMIASTADCVTAGTYTKNVVKAAPVLWDRDITASDKPVRAVVVNAGIANACTGREGLEYCKRTSEAAAKALSEKYGASIEKDQILVASTGVIGMQLPIEKLETGARDMTGKLDNTREAANLAARAIMTTDTIPKEAAATVEIGGQTVTIAAMTKGSGMIHPNMCTMLCFVTTDAAIDKKLLQTSLSDVVEDTFNMISVDGDTSTNDTCVVLANGLAGNRPIDSESSDYEEFKAALFEVLKKLAMMMGGDGEGATALFEVIVNGAKTKEEAKILAKSVITSSLTKAAIYGHDANWGRILCALGYSGIEFDPDAVELTFSSAAGTLLIARDGHGTDFDEEEATRILSEDHVTAICEMNRGGASATAWGCDLTHEYVSINADYRS
ncbi:MAG: bifunctional glutamate N-acetyltransferase/amino-acid acetyltransferase ArgJ [Lachnospiraceae bacterium]|nr:bifunctional glutamate N-acetyltransferase/amino-acid acetyltransferase ArgJ [Lachnospiraceae bacterium]